MTLQYPAAVFSTLHLLFSTSSRKIISLLFLSGSKPVPSVRCLKTTTEALIAAKCQWLQGSHSFFDVCSFNYVYVEDWLIVFILVWVQVACGGN